MRFLTFFILANLACIAVSSEFDPQVIEDYEPSFELMDETTPKIWNSFVYYPDSEQEMSPDRGTDQVGIYDYQVYPFLKQKPSIPLNQQPAKPDSGIEVMLRHLRETPERNSPGKSHLGSVLRGV